MNNFLSIVREIDSINPEIIFSIGGFGISNSTISIFLVIIFVLFVCFGLIRRFSISPKKGQVVIELLYHGIAGFVSQLAGDKKKGEKLIPIIGSVFLFILFSNLFGSIPGLTSFTYEGKPLFRPPTADFNTTFSLALGSLIIIQILSIKDFGILGYIGRFLKFKDVFLGFKKGMAKGFIAIIEFLIGILDIISEIAKVVSLSLRLFGNMYAGLVLGTVISASVAYILPSAFVALGLLVAVVQAIVFSSLITVYYTMSLKE